MEHNVETSVIEAKWYCEFRMVYTIPHKGHFNRLPSLLDQIVDSLPQYIAVFYQVNKNSGVPLEDHDAFKMGWLYTIELA